MEDMNTGMVLWLLLALAGLVILLAWGAAFPPDYSVPLTDGQVTLFGSVCVGSLGAMFLAVIAGLRKRDA